MHRCSYVVEGALTVCGAEPAWSERSSLISTALWSKRRSLRPSHYALAAVELRLELSEAEVIEASGDLRRPHERRSTQGGYRSPTAQREVS